jgi:hypothetical protein
MPTTSIVVALTAASQISIAATMSLMATSK